MAKKIDATNITEKDSLFELLFLENTNPIFIGNSDGKVIAVNKEAVELTQYSETEILGIEKIDFLFPEEELRREPLQYDNLFKNKIVNNERRLRRKDGSIVWISMKSKQLSDGHLVAIMTDIQDKKKFEKMAKENERIVQNIIDSTPEDIIFLKDGEGRWLKANKAFSDLFGIENSDYLGKTTKELAEENYFFKKTFLECMEMDKKAWEQENLFREDLIVHISEDENKIFDIIKVPTFDDDGSRKSLTIFGRDVTEERKRQKEIKEKEEMYRLVVENAHEAIIVLRDGIIEYVNPAVEAISGFSSDEYIYNAFIDFVHVDDRSRLVDYHFRRLEGDNTLPDLYEFRVISKTGEILWLEVKSVKVQWKGTPAIMSFIRNITEEKKAIRQLIENENKFRSIVQTMEDGVFRSDHDGKILFASLNFVKDKGYSVEEVIGKNLFEFIYEKDRASVYGAWQKIKTIKSVQMEFRLLKKNGEPFWVRSRNSVVIKDDGKMDSVISIIIDIQERKNIEDKLRKSEVKFRRVIESAPVGITILQNKKIAFLNPQLVKILKYQDYNELLESDFMDYVEKESKEALSDYIENLNKVKTFESPIECGFVARTREKVDCIIIGQQTEFREEKSIQLYIYDITEKKNSEKMVSQLTRAVEQSSTMVYITDKERKIEYVNNAFLQETGYSEEEVIGANVNLLESGKNDPQLHADLWKTISNGKDWSGELINKRKNGTYYWVSLTISPINDNAGNLTHFVAISENIDKQKEIEKYLRISKKKAEQSEKLKSDFIAQVSHELRTPVNTMLNFANLLREQLKDPDRDRDASMQFISFIESGGNRLVRTMDLMVDMQEIQNKTFEPHFKVIDLADDILAGVLADFTHDAQRKGLRINRNILTNNYFVFADEYCLAQIFKQIVDNSVKYTEEGEININIFRNEENFLVTEITDTGIGIKKEFLPKIFDLFTQEESGYTRKFEGNGLGLSVTKQFCDMNYIDLKIESEKNVGTTITLIFNQA